MIGGVDVLRLWGYFVKASKGRAMAPPEVHWRVLVVRTWWRAHHFWEAQPLEANWIKCYLLLLLLCFFFFNNRI